MIQRWLHATHAPTISYIAHKHRRNSSSRIEDAGSRRRYSLYEGYYIWSAISIRFFQVFGKFAYFRSLYLSKNEDNFDP